MAAAPANGEQDNYATPRQEFPYDSTENLFRKELDTKLDDIKKKMQDLDSKLEDLKVMRPISKIEEYISKVIPWIWVFGVGCGFILLFRELMTPSVCVMPADLLDKSCIFLRR